MGEIGISAPEQPELDRYKVGDVLKDACVRVEEASTPTPSSLRYAAACHTLHAIACAM